jgi:parvulin-like peptidyl-prolyl isomerase
MTKKKSKANKMKSLAFTIVLAGIVIAVFAYLISTEGNILPENQAAAVIVNGEPISEAELDEAYNSLPVAYQSIVSREEVLDQLINKELMLQEAMKRGIQASQDEIEEQLQLVKSQFPTEDAFLEILEQQNLTLAEVEDQIREQTILNKVINESVISKIEISEEEIGEYYKENEEQFSAGEDQIRAAHILVESEDEAEEILDLLDEGEDFGQLAVEYSIDPSVSVNQGDLGFFSRGDMVEEFERAAFALRAGEVSSVVESQFGFHIIKRLPSRITLEEAKDSIKMMLVRNKQQLAVDEFIEELRENSDIRIVGSDSAQRGEEIINQEKKNEFDELLGQVCVEEEMPIVRFYTSSSCQKCKEMLSIFEDAVEDQDLSVYIWELDTGDNLYTNDLESSIPREEFEALKEYNPNGAVPAYVFGCKYVRIGNAYSQVEYDRELDAFNEILDMIR